MDLLLRFKADSPPVLSVLDPTDVVGHVRMAYEAALAGFDIVVYALQDTTLTVAYASVMPEPPSGDEMSSARE